MGHSEAHGAHNEGNAWNGIFSDLCFVQSIATCVGFGQRYESLPGRVVISSPMLTHGLPLQRWHVAHRCLRTTLLIIKRLPGFL